MIDELTTFCETRRPIVDSTLKKTAELNIVGAIKDHIETLALQATLKKEESHIRENFQDLFEPIPHVNRLPTDCLAEIHLKDPTLRVRAIHECTRELTRTRTCEYFNSQTGTCTRANSFPRVTRTHESSTHESSTHELQVHPPSCKYL